MMANYERLSGLDACFLGFETPNSPMHVAVTAIFEQGPALPSGWRRSTVDGVREHIAGRLPLVPRFRQRLAYLPVMRDAVWVDDERVRLSRHVRHASLPRPGSTAAAPAALRRDPRAAARSPASALGGVGHRGPRGRRLRVRREGAPLHRRRDRRHRHAGGAARPDADPGAGVARERWQPRPAPDRAPAPARRGRRARPAARVEIGRALGRVLSDPRGRRRRARRRGGQPLATGSQRPLGRARRVLQPADRTAPARSPGRQFDLGRVKAIARRLGGTVNDVVLTVVSGAIGGALRRRGEHGAGQPLRAVVPVSVRQRRGVRRSGQPRLALAGAASGGRARPAPAVSRDPRDDRRAEAQRRGERAGRWSAEAANWAGGAVVESTARLIGSSRIYNLIVTNVPGPSIPLYLAGSRMREAYPAPAPVRAAGYRDRAPQLHRAAWRSASAPTWNLGDLLHDIAGRLETGLAELGSVAGLAAADGPEAVQAQSPPRKVALRRAR